MNKHKIRKMRGVREVQRCYLCNNKAQDKCSDCKTTICNDCKSSLNNKKCYKCDVLVIEK